MVVFAELGQDAVVTDGNLWTKSQRVPQIKTNVQDTRYQSKV